MRANAIQRFTYAERVVHWVVGVTFVFLLLTGLAFSYPKLFWLTSIVGGGAVARVLHPWVGLVFTVGLVFMVLLWIRDMYLDRHDIAWLKAIRHYVAHDRDNVPPAGKYNGGQKLFFWVQSVLGVVFLITGLLLWFPDGFVGLGPFGRGILSAMRLLHYLAALGGGLFLIVHIYLGTVAYPGTARGMIDGKVTRAWAKLHHPQWHREKTES